MKLITHPNNEQYLQQMGAYKYEFGMNDMPWRSLFDMSVVFDSSVPEKKKSGKYIVRGHPLPVARADLVVPDGRFFEWGNSDLEIKWMLLWGMIQEHEEPQFLIMDDSIDVFNMKIPLTLNVNHLMLTHNVQYCCTD